MMMGWGLGRVCELSNHWQNICYLVLIFQNYFESIGLILPLLQIIADGEGDQGAN